MSEVGEPPGDEDAQSGVEHLRALVDWDAELDAALGTVDAPLDLYEEASWYRPISTGDIFFDVPVPGCTQEEHGSGLTMILAHPSAMREGAVLEERARAGPVVHDSRISRKKYTPGFYDLFTLPGLSTPAKEAGHELKDQPWAALLGITGTIETASLDVKRRIACLSPTGVTLLIQKLVHCDTRHAVRLDTVGKVMAEKLEEIEQLQQWNEELAAPRVDAGESLQTVLLEAADTFEAALQPLRPLLVDPVRRGVVWRQIAQERRALRAQ